ncbi:RcnB family protein [Massilia sp. TN1-12]|uniref:RcnB family protein n=1 Tax=Massilia paldalensis TaxID=3377675 RepID=UPI00384E3446
MNNKKIIVATLMVALLGAGASSFAQDRYHGDRDRDRHEQRDDRRDYRDDRRDERRDHRDDRYARHDGRHDGAGPDRNFHRGERLPDRYRHNQYVVNDWRGHRLRQPPRGYHWVQTGSDYVLAAIATGVIADLIINH